MDGMTTVLDWRTLAPPQEIHDCDCDYCDRQGEHEDVLWPLLVKMDMGGVRYVTDKYLAVRESFAPVPEGYEGTVLEDAKREPTGFMAAAVTNEPVTAMEFRWHILKAVEAAGWRLRVLAHPSDASDSTKRSVGVVTADGEHIGWAIGARQVNNDCYDNGFTREYIEPAS